MVGEKRPVVKQLEEDTARYLTVESESGVKISPLARPSLHQRRQKYETCSVHGV